MTNPTYVIGRSTRGGICPTRKIPANSDRKVMKALLNNFYDLRRVRCYGVEVKPLDHVTYTETFEWRGFELWGTSPFMLRTMKKIAELTDKGVKFTAIIDRFDTTGKRETVCFNSRNPYAHHIIVAESCIDAQWISVGFSYDDTKEDADCFELEINPDLFMHIVGDEETGFEWECFPKDIEHFINREDMREWLDAMADTIEAYMNPDCDH